MNPNLNYGERLPGVFDGAASGVIHLTRRGAIYSDCAELLRHSQSWTDEDEMAWQQWIVSWLEWLTTHEFGIIESDAPNRGNHATWMWVHTLAMAKAAGWQRLALNWMSRLQFGFPTALVTQIESTGKMPTEAARPTGAVYAMFGLTAIFKLGTVVDSICRDWECSNATKFKWDSPTSLSASQETARWLVLQEATTDCADKLSEYADTVFKKSCDVPDCVQLVDLNEETCRNRCLAVGKEERQHNGTSCNTINLRYNRGVADECYFRGCRTHGDGASWTKREEPSPSTGLLWQKHAYLLPPKEGTGSVRRAVNYLIPYANGTKDWRSDHPNQMSWEGGDWRNFAPILHQAALVFGEQSYAVLIPSIKQDRFADFRAEWLKDKIHLVQPLAPISIQIPTSTPSSSAPKQYSLAPTRDFSNASCDEIRSWIQLRPLQVQGSAVTGGACVPVRVTVCVLFHYP